MPSWQGKSRGNTTGFRIFVWVLKHAGLAPAYLLLRFVAFYFFLFSGKAFRYQYHVFQEAPAVFMHGPQFTSIYKNYYWFGQTIIDQIVLMSGMKHPFRFEFEGEEYLREMVGSAKGWTFAERAYRKLGNCRSSFETSGNRNAYRNV